MSAQRTMPPARQTPLKALWPIALATVAAAAGFAGARAVTTWTVASAASPDASRVAFVTDRPCRNGPCQSLWIGASPDAAREVAVLSRGTERCDEVAWSRDGRQVGFVVNGHALRLYDAAAGVPAGQVELVPGDAMPTTRIARGVTFSDNGRAVTFDDCPRRASGCRAGLVGVPQADQR